MPDSNPANSKSVSNPELDIEKLADLCAVGVIPIPDDLPEDQQRKLMVAIAQRRRKRLVHLFASAIADDIWRERQV
jgi:hypothetical protein